jgi:hypothetical protein
MYHPPPLTWGVHRIYASGEGRSFGPLSLMQNP